MYKHNSTCLGTIWSEPATDPPNLSFPGEIYFAQLVNAGGADRGEATDEMIHAYKTDDYTWVYKYALNTASGTEHSWGSWNLFNPGDCDALWSIAFADLNNDGLDDFFCIGLHGQVSVSLNLGGNPPKWDGLHEIIGAQPSTYYDANVRIAECVHPDHISF